MLGSTATVDFPTGPKDEARAAALFRGALERRRSLGAVGRERARAPRYGPREAEKHWERAAKMASRSRWSTSARSTRAASPTPRRSRRISTKRAAKMWYQAAVEKGRGDAACSHQRIRAAATSKRRGPRAFRAFEGLLAEENVAGGPFSRPAR